MRHIKTIETLRTFLTKVEDIDAALLYGSYARNDFNGNSDLDIKLIVDKTFDSRSFISLLLNEFKGRFVSIKHIELRNKIVIYFNDAPKLEFGICYDTESIKRDFLGSEITIIEDIILFERNPKTTKIEAYLKHLITLKRSIEIDKHSINDLIDKFVYEFESCSSKHGRSDGYQFYYFYNIAFHLAVQLHYLAKGKKEYYFLPKNFMTAELSTAEQANFRELSGTVFLPEANKRKRALLDFFYKAVESLVSHHKYKELKEFCEWIYKRDFFWNFRDSNLYNPKIKNMFIYRTSTLSLFQNTKQLDDLLKEHNIKTIIDLRADKEIERIPYSQDRIKSLKYVKAQFDPWDQPEWFKEKHNEGSNHEIAYRFFAMGCKVSVKKVFETILEHEEGSIAIHCHAGKDRTGILFSMLHLLLESSGENLTADYLASEMDVTMDKLNIALDVIENEGGISHYLESCGLTKAQISNLKDKLPNE